MSLFHTIAEQAAHGNFSFFILVANVLAVWFAIKATRPSWRCKKRSLPVYRISTVKRSLPSCRDIESRLYELGREQESGSGLRPVPPDVFDDISVVGGE